MAVRIVDVGRTAHRQGQVIDPSQSAKPSEKGYWLGVEIVRPRTQVQIFELAQIGCVLPAED